MASKRDIFDALYSLSYALESREAGLTSKKERITAEIRVSEKHFGMHIFENLPALEGMEFAKGFSSDFGRRLSEARQQLDSNLADIRKLETDRETLVAKIGQYKTSDDVDAAALRIYQSTTASLEKQRSFIDRKRRALDYDKAAAKKIENFIGEMAREQKARLFGFLFDRPSGARLATAREVFAEWEVYIAKKQRDLLSREKIHEDTRAELDNIVALHGSSLRAIDAAMKADGATLAMVDDNLKMSMRNKEVAEESLLELQSSRNADLINWVLQRVQAQPELMDHLTEKGILDAEGAKKATRVIGQINEAKDQLERVQQDFDNGRTIRRTVLLAYGALRDSGWEQSRTAFPIDAEALRTIRTGGNGCLALVKEVIETAKTKRPSFRDMNHAIPRPARFAV